MSHPEDELPPTLGAALWSFFFHQEVYVRLASQQDLWVNLQKADLRRAYVGGDLEDDEARRARAARHAKYRKTLLANLRGSAIAASMCGLLAWWISLYLALPPLSSAKWLALASGLTGLWAGLIQMNVEPVYGGRARLDQVVSAAVTRALVCVAAVLALLAGAMP